MTTYLLTGGGTAGHVNPLLAVADQLRSEEPESSILVLGTREGLEARLVPERGYELITIDKLPFPRRPNVDALRFLPRFVRAVREVRRVIAERDVDVVVGFGGYASAPAYLAVRRTGRPLIIHEQNAKPGMANKLGARITRHVGVAFEHTPLRHGQLVGMPLRHEIETLDRTARRAEAIEFFGLDADRPTVLVTGGSLGARRINQTVTASAEAIVEAGWQVLHVTGSRDRVADAGGEHYRVIEYCDRMDLALAAADFAIARAGASTVSEFSALGVGALYVPYPVGNGEQAINAREVCAAGGGRLVDDDAFTPDYVRHSLVPFLTDPENPRVMGDLAATTGVRDGARRMVALIRSALR